MLEDARQCLLERGCSDGAGLLATGTKKIHGRAEIQTSVLLTAEKDIVDIILPNPCNLADILQSWPWQLMKNMKLRCETSNIFAPNSFDNLSFWNIRFVLRHFFHHMFHKASVSGSKQCGRCGRDVAANGWSQRLGDGDGSVDGDFCGGAPGTADFDPKKYSFGKGETSTIYKKKNANVWRSEEFCVELAVVFVKFFFRKRSK